MQDADMDMQIMFTRTFRCSWMGGGKRTHRREHVQAHVLMHTKFAAHHLNIATLNAQGPNAERSFIATLARQDFHRPTPSPANDALSFLPRKLALLQDLLQSSKQTSTSNCS